MLDATNACGWAVHTACKHKQQKLYKKDGTNADATRTPRSEGIVTGSIEVSALVENGCSQTVASLIENEGLYAGLSSWRARELLFHLPF